MHQPFEIQFEANAQFNLLLWMFNTNTDPNGITLEINFKEVISLK